jgi:hypothetical protein
MKKIFVIVLFILGFTVFTITQASAGCTIVWTGDLSGSVATQETSRTQQAAYEAFMAIQPHSPTGFTDDCYYYSYHIHLRTFDEDEGDQVCLDGTWSYYHYVAGSGCPVGCETNRTGTWDVVGECTTTSSIATTTTTAPATVIQLSSFTATPKAGAVILQWNTESETDNAGFNIYRAESEDGQYAKINTAMIPAKGSSTGGESYEFTDNNVRNRKTYYYKLEDVDLNGTATVHGPVSAMPRLIYGLGK